MSQQDPVFHDLEFFGDAPFWAEGGNATRRTFLMPLPDPAGFLAFGVVGPSDTVLFVARGKVREHMGAFIARMAQAGASVELYDRPPLPWHLVKRYTSDDPYEGQETEGPKNPPVNGIAYGGGADPDHKLWAENRCERMDGDTRLWPAHNPNREVIISPMGHGTGFMAFGVCRSKPGDFKELFVFAARGRVEDQLSEFIVRMKRAGASVRLHDWPPVKYVSQYIKEHHGALFSEDPAAPSGESGIAPASARAAVGRG